MSKIILGLISAALVSFAGLAASAFVAGVFQEKALRGMSAEVYAPPTDVTRTEPKPRSQWRDWPTTERLVVHPARSPGRRPDPVRAPLASGRSSV